MNTRSTIGLATMSGLPARNFSTPSKSASEPAGASSNPADESIFASADYFKDVNPEEIAS